MAKQAKTIRKEVNDLISKGELGKGIDRLKQFLQDKSGKYRDYHQQITALDGEYADWRKKNALGLEPKDAIVNRIRYETLQLADKIIEPKPVSKPANKVTSSLPSWLINLTIFLVVGGLTMYFLVGRKPAFEYDSSSVLSQQNQEYLYEQLGGTSWQTNSNWGNIIFDISGRKAIIPNGQMEIVNRLNNRFTGNYSVNGQYIEPIQIEIVPNGQIFFWRGGVNQTTLPELPEIWKKLE